MDDSEDGCYSFIKEYQAEGKIKHIGFSTHGTAETIMKMIESNKFDYVNIHCHHFGSYHGEGTPDTKGGHGNLACVKKALELDMGVFQISPFDKGGKLYKPSTAVAKAIGPDLAPISFAALHSWKTLGFHTVSVGFARVSDLDEVLEAACLYEDEKAMVALQQAETNLKNMSVEKLGQEWHDKGLLNIPSCYKESTTGVAIGHILWLHNVCTAFGMYEFARDRYSNLESTTWNDKKTFAENLDKMNSGNSGRTYQPDVDLTEALKDHYDSELVKMKLAEAHEWLTQSKDVLTDKHRKTKGWDEAYSLSVWEDFPGDPTRSGFRGSVMLQGLTGGYFGVNNKGDRRQSLEKAKSLRSSFRSSFTSISSEGEN
jgi:predicted aldo/keto reductase-like oxidoreductase